MAQHLFEQLKDMHVQPLGEGVMALDALVMIKVIDEDGDLAWVTRYTENLGIVEVLGALRLASVAQEATLANKWFGRD